ncbi:MAG TPA: DUF4365 domain-containing protein, partial [Jiangellaceae bacterium]|nr:DUF4365 domain-containing protein [Jiangellaceae bacterium]
QNAREIVVSDWGLDMEVEFKDDNHQPTGRRVWLQLNSGDSHLRHRRRDDTHQFRLNERHALRPPLAPEGPQPPTRDHRRSALSQQIR